MKKQDVLRMLGNSEVLGSILDTTAALIAVTDKSGSILYVNNALQKTTGFSKSDYLGRPIWAFRAVDDVAPGKKLFFDLAEGQTEFQSTTRWRHKDGGHVLLEWTVKRVHDTEGVEIGRFGTAVNVTETARAAARVMAAERKRKILEHVTENLTEPLFFINPDGTIAYANGATERVYGYAPGELIGKPSSILRPMDRVDVMSAYIERLHASGKAEMMETDALNRNGRRIPVELRTAPVFEEGEYIGLASVVYDMVERKALEQELRRIAGTDALTGVANRLGFQTTADNEVKRAERYKHSLSVFVADIDHFKQVNDTMGHAAGDAALRNFADVLSATLRRPIDHIARTGGEEFVAILPETDRKGAIAAAERARQGAEASSIIFDYNEIAVTASFGVSCWVPGEENLDDAVKRADAALYRAKEGGRNRVVFEDQDSGDPVSVAV